MNNEVLRRKLFRTVLADSRSPAGILASSPEMVETVQKRAQGGMNTSDAQYIQAIGQLAQQGDKATLENIFADTRLPTTVRNAAREAIGSLTTKQAASPVMNKISGFGQGILDAADATNKGVIDFLSTAARNDAERLSNASTGFMSGVDKIGSALYQTLTPQGARQAREKRKALREPSPTDSRLDQMLKSTPSMPGVVEMAGDASDAIVSGIRSLTTPVSVLEAEKMVAGGDGDDLGSAPTSYSVGEEDGLGSAPSKTVAEEVSEAAVSGADTQSVVSGGRKVSTAPPGDEAQDIANRVDEALALGPGRSQEALALESKLSGLKQDGKATIRNLEADLQAASDNMLGLTQLSEKGIRDAQAGVDAANTAFEKAMKIKRAEAKEFTLEDVKDEALKLSGIEDADYDGKRENAFWFNLMRAGLSMAAGESDNALTNIAKGLGFGLEGYGKDIGTIDSQEREDRKELRNLQLTLINNKNSKALADAAAENEFTFQKQNLAQAALQGANSRLVQAQATDNANRLAMTQLDSSTALSIANLKSTQTKAEQDIEITLAQMDRQDRQIAEQRAFDTWKTNLATVPPEVWDVISLGGEYATQGEDGTWTMTAKGEAYYKTLISASLTSGLKVTDLDKSVRAVAQGQSIQGIPLGENQADRLLASGIWVRNYKDEFDKAEPYAKRNVLERYIRDAGEYLDPNMPLNILDSIFPSK